MKFSDLLNDNININEFVSDKETLLKELNLNNNELNHEIINYKIYLINQSTNNLSILLNQINSFIIPLISNYIWNYQGFSLTIESITINNQSISYLNGITNVFDDINDEWFIVYLLYQLSNHFHDIIIQINDNDGEFLLIETSNELPDWIDSNEYSNRVWIHNNQLYIISNDITNKSYRIDHALHDLTYSKQLYLASNNIQSIINHRISIYSSNYQSLHHTTICVLPIAIVNLLITYPQLLPYIINTLDITDKTIRNKVINRLTYLKSLNLVDSMIALTQIKLTKLLYAKLLYLQIPSTKSIDRYLNNCIHSIDLSTYKNKDRIIEVSRKLLVGLELMYQCSITNNINYDINYNINNKHIHTLIDEFIRQPNNNISTNPITNHKILYEDDDDWLNITLDSLEKSISKYTNNQVDGPLDQHINKQLDSDIDKDNHMTQLNNIIDKFDSFLDYKSNLIDGVDNSNKLNHTSTNTTTSRIVQQYLDLYSDSDEDSELDSEFGNDGDSEVGSNSDSKLDNKIYSSIDSAIDNKPDSKLDTEANPPSSMLGCSNRTIDSNILSDVNSSHSIDSDDEIASNESNDLVDDDSLVDLSHYQLAMDNEILSNQSILSKSFNISSNESNDIQIDEQSHLLTYLFESHTASMEIGNSGPVRQLMSQLDVQLPYIDR